MRALSLLPLALALLGVAHAQPLVVVDAGHGGRDPGAVGCGLQEKASVLDTSRRLGDLLRAAGLRAALTRDDDTFVELRARAAFANDRNAALFFSIHANANGGDPATGTETWIARGASAASSRFANTVQAAMVRAWGLRDRGVKSENFTVLTATSMPAALAEMGFINRCDPDAALLGDGGARQRMAQAMAEAVTSHLGVDPPDPQPGNDRGTLIGVVFADQGVGLEDPSVRLGGAQVRVQQTGDTTRSADGTGGWEFSLPPGEYTVRATLDGYVPAERTCAVAANQQAWCSVGLQRDAPDPPPPADMAPPPPPPEDAGVGPVVDAAPPRVDAAPPGADVGPLPRPDARPPAPPRDGGVGGLFDRGVAPSPLGAEQEEDVAVSKASGDGGCTLTPAGRASPAALVLLLLPLLLLRRRRGAAALILVAALPLTARAHVPDVPAGGVELAPDTEALPLVAAGPERILARGDFAAPLLSPDAAHVAVPARDLATLMVVPLAGGSPRALVEGPRVGHRPLWQDTDTLAFRTPGQSALAVPLRARTLDGAEVAPKLTAPGFHLRLTPDDQVELRQRGVAYRISPPGDRYVTAVAGPTGDHVVLWGLRTGLTVYRVADGKTTPLGPGGHPAFDPTGRWLVFERTTDEGGQLTGGDLLLCDLHDADLPLRALTRSADRIELAPSLAGRTLVFLAGDALIAVELDLPE